MCTRIHAPLEGREAVPMRTRHAGKACFHAENGNDKCFALQHRQEGREHGQILGDIVPER